MTNANTKTAPTATEVYPCVQYSLRTLLMVMTVIAVLAAILAPLFRARTAEGTTELLVVWSSALIWLGLSYCIDVFSDRKRVVRTLSLIGDDYRYRMRVLPTAFADALQRPIRMLLRLLGVVCVVVVYSAFTFFGESSTNGAGRVIFISLLYGMSVGGSGYAFLLARPAYTVFLRDSGVNLDGRLIPWSYIRGAQWLPTRPNVLRLHRLDGDMLVKALPQRRDEIEAYVKQHVTAAGNPAFGHHD